MVVPRINTTGVRLCCKIAEILILKATPSEVAFFHIGTLFYLGIGVFFLALVPTWNIILSPEFYKQYIDVGR